MIPKSLLEKGIWHSGMGVSLDACDTYLIAWFKTKLFHYQPNFLLIQTPGRQDKTALQHTGETQMDFPPREAGHTGETQMDLPAHSSGLAQSLLQTFQK